MLINTASCTPAAAARVLLDMFPLKQTVMIWGPPGVGKSELVAATARSLGASFIDVRLATKTAADIGGLPALDHETRTTRFYPPAFLPREEGPGVLFFDELPGADEQTKIAVYGLMLERRLDQYQLPDGWMIVAAGNREEDGAYSVDLGTALNDRLVHLVVEPEVDDWIKWAMNSGIDPRVISFIKRHPNRLHGANEALKKERAVFPTPRSWARVSDQVKAIQDRRSLKLSVAGTVGDSVATEFFRILDEIDNLATVEKILESTDRQLANLLPETLPGFYSLAYALAARIPQNPDPLDTSEEGMKRESRVRREIERMWEIVVFLGDWKPKSKTLMPKESRTFLGTLLSERMLDVGRSPGGIAAFLEYDRQTRAAIDGK